MWCGGSVTPNPSGRILSENLREDQAKDKLSAMVHSTESTIGKAPFKGSQKVWIWDSYVMSQIAWMLLIHDIAPTFVDALQAVQTRCFKKWLGYTRTGNNSIFYRSREHHGLQLKEMASWHKQNRLIRRHILSSSKDPQVREIHNWVKFRQMKSVSNEWNDCVELESLKHVVMHEKTRGPLMQARAGVGYRCAVTKAQSPEQAERESVLRVYKEILEQERLVGVLSKLTNFGEWVKWEAAMQLDMRWHSLLASESDSVLRFLMCATEDVLPTPAMLKLWGQGDGACPQGCVKEKGSLRHILCGCWAALNEKPQSRIKWRHDSLLLAIFKAILGVIT